ncbi:MAG: PAS domain S-box protein, partial [Cyanobacteriota bacterium]
MIIGLGLTSLIYLGSVVQASHTSMMLLFGSSLNLIFCLWLYYFLNCQITKRQQAEAKFQDLYNHAPCGYHSLDEDGTFIAINDTELSWLGYSREEVVGKLEMTDLLTPETVIPFDQAFGCLRSQGWVKDVEIQLIRKDGTILPALLSATAIRDEAGNFVAARVTIFDITVRKQTEEALRQSEQRFRLAVDNIPDSFVIYDAQRRLQFVNAEGLRRTGLPEEAIRGRTDEEIHPIEVRSGYLPTLLQAVETRTLQTTECTITLPTVGTFTVAATYVPLLDEQGEIYQILGITHDLTQRKRVEQALRESEERLRLALEAADMGTWDWNILTDQITWSSNPQHLFGGATDRLAGSYEALETCIVPEDRKLFMQVMKHARRTRHDFQHEFRLVWPDGSIHWMEGKGKFFYDEAGRAIRMVGTLMDISDRKQVETQLKQSEQKFRQLAENINQVFWMSNADLSEILYVSPAFEEIWGRSRESLYTNPKSFLDAIHPDDRRLAIANLERNLSGEFDIEYRIVQPDGSVRWIRDRAFPIRNESGTVYRRAGITQDITQEKQAEACLLQVNEELEERVAKRTAQLKQAAERLQRELLERERVERALRESEERWQLAIRGSKDGIWDLNLQTDEVFYSPRWKEMLGYENHEIGNHLDEWLKRVHPDDLERTIQIYQDHLSRKTPFYTNEHRLLCKDGTYKWILTRGQALWDEKSNPIRVTGSHTDISDRKQAEEALRESKEQLQAILDNSPTVIYLIDVQNRHLLVNRGYEHLVALSNEQIAFQSLYDVWPQEIADTFVSNNRRVLEQETPIEIEEIIPHDDGLHTYFTIKFPLYDANGSPYAVCGISTDITERKQAEEVLRKQACIFENLYDGVILTDLDGCIIDWNPAAERIFGYAKVEVLGKATGILHKPEEVAMLTPKIVKEVLATGRWAGEVNFIRKDGTEGVCETVVVPLYSQQGQAIATIGVNRDITDRKQAEAALRQAYDELELRVAERTQELAKANEELQLENAERKRVEAELKTRARQQAAVAELGQKALAGQPLSMLIDQAVALIAQILDVEYCKVLKLLPDGKTLLLRAGVGWHDELVGQVTIGVELNSQAGYTLLSREPVIVEDLRTEMRFGGSCLLRQHQVVSGLTVIIPGQHRPYGVLGAHTSRLRKFTEDDIHFLQATANVLTTAIDRQRAEEALRRAHDELEIRVTERTTDLEKANAELQQKIIELQLSQEERAKLIAILEATPDFVATATVDEQVHYLNSAARKVFGFGEHEDSTHFTIADSQPDWAYEILRHEGIPGAMRDGVWMGETAILNHDGREIPVSQVIIAHKSPDGNVKMLSTVARDITQQKKIAATLFESERRWRSLLENVRLVVVGMDNKGRVDYVNPCFLDLVGYTKAEVMGQDWFEMFLPQHQKKRQQNNFVELLEQEFYTHNQSIILTKSGEERVIAWNNTLLQDLQGYVVGTLSIGEDITERQVIERMKDEFISVVSHELRTPLTSIHGALNLLSSGLVDTHSDKGRRVIEIAAQSAERLVRLVNDILELERLESGKISLLKQTCDATELITKAMEMMQVMANRAGITLCVSAQAINLYADPDRIIQVLTNLLGNAIKFSPRGSTVCLSVEQGTQEGGYRDSR